jgi:hypothetical protein
MSIDLCYVISHGFAARMILHSDILPHLRQRGISVALVVPNADEANMRALAEKHDVTLIQAPVLKSRVLREYETWLRRYLFEDVLANPALRSWHYRLLDLPQNRIRNNIRARLYMGLNRVARRFPQIQGQLDRLEEKVFLNNPEVADILASVNPQVVVSTYPVAILEACFLHAAQAAGLTTVSQLLSWDNITSKGRFSVSSDYYITWGPIMAAEVQEYYPMDPARIFECGVAHFDRHITGPDLQQTEQILYDLGLNPGRQGMPVFSRVIN